jgi:hypothetical protein
VGRRSRGAAARRKGRRLRFCRFQAQVQQVSSFRLRFSRFQPQDLQVSGLNLELV